MELIPVKCEMGQFLHGHNILEINGSKEIIKSILDVFLQRFCKITYM